MDKTRTNSSVLVVLQRDLRIPLHQQIETSIRDSIRAGRLPRGSSLPPSRILAADLGVSRGVVVEAYQQLASEGYLASNAGSYTQAAAGARRLALEDPSSGDDALPAARAAGLEVIGVPVDRDGIRVDVLAETGADAVVLTPSHQFPTGSVLSAENRAAVLRWAAER